MNTPVKSIPQPRSLRGNFLTFLVPSMAGLLLFLLPIIVDGNFTIPIAALAKSLKTYLSPSMAAILLATLGGSTLVGVWAKLATPAWTREWPEIGQILAPSWGFLGLRALGTIFAGLVFFKVGPKAITSGATGGLLFNDLLPMLFAIFILAGFFFPLLLNFGLIEFLGSFFSKFMKPLFGLPGRSAIDCLASWCGDGTVGVMMTAKQYEKGHYTSREACSIATNFSVVSLSFGLVVLAQVKLDHLFLQFYSTVCLAGIITAMIVSRLPPLSLKPNISSNPEDLDQSSLTGLQAALKRVESIDSPWPSIKEGCLNVTEMLLGLLPVIMAVGTVSLIVAEHTPIFSYLGQPFIPLLEALNLPEAEAASASIMVGFADMFVPSILATSIESDLTRFVIAALSINQLIYLSEVGSLIIGSSIPLKLWELFAIFVTRTLISLPIIAAMGHWLVP